MGGKVYDRRTLVVDRDPSRQLAVEVGKFPKPDPIDLVTAFANALNEYGLQAFEDVTGLDLTGLKAALDRLKSLLGGIDLFDGDAFDRAEAIAQFIASIPAGLIGTDAYLEEWRREPRECGDDLEGEVAQEVEWLEAAYTDDVLERLVRANGRETG